MKTYFKLSTWMTLVAVLVLAMFGVAAVPAAAPAAGKPPTATPTARRCRAGT